MTATLQSDVLAGTTSELGALLGRAPRWPTTGKLAREAVLGHEERVGRLCEAVGRELGMSVDHASRLRLAGELHDIGKRVIPDQILLKPGKLTAEEWDVVRRHPAAGAEVIAAVGLDDIADWVLAHHERPDGLGYPHGRKDEALGLEPRILAVADAFDAMTSDRVYRPAMSIEEAFAELDAGTGTQFDGDVVAALFHCV